jgi:hypothetical protein
MFLEVCFALALVQLGAFAILQDEPLAGQLLGRVVFLEKTTFLEELTFPSHTTIPPSTNCNILHSD